MAILNILQIQNQQVYSFYAMVNATLFLAMGFTLLYVMSYLLGSPGRRKPCCVCWIGFSEAPSS